MALAEVPITPAAAPAMDSAALPTVAPAPSAPAETAPAAETAPEIPEPVAKNPVVISVLTGQIPGVRVRPLYYPKAYELAKYAEDIVGMGLDFYGAQDSSTVLFNPAKITQEELATADQKGILDKVLPDYEKLSGEAPTEPPKGTPGFETPADQKLMGSGPTPKVASQLPAPEATAPPPAPARTKIATARVANMLPQQPTEGSAPVSGRIARGMAKTVI